jgi:para-nitrobenzyl esterase
VERPRRGGGAGHNGVSADTASLIAGQLLDLLAIVPGDLDALDRVPSPAILEAEAAIAERLETTRDVHRFGEAAASAMAFQPTYGTDLLPQRPIDAIAGGAAKNIEVLVGTTRDEALINLVDLRRMFNETLVESTMNEVFRPVRRSGSDVLALYRANRPSAQLHELVAAVETDRMFTVPAVRLADAQTNHNPDVWRDRFDWPSVAALAPPRTQYTRDDGAERPAARRG